MSDPTPETKLKVLVTAFAANGDDANISGETLKRLQASYPNVELITLLLPPEYLAAEQALNTAIAAHKPDFVVSLGEINGESDPGLQIERVAHSKSSWPDRRDEAPEICTPDENQQITSYFPKLESMLSNSFSQHLESTDDAVISLNGGGYLCNHIHYTALKAQAAQGKPGQAIFLHLDDMTPIKLPGEDICDQASATLSPQLIAFRDFMLKQRCAIVSERYANVVGDLLTYLGAHSQEYMQGHCYAVEKKEHMPVEFKKLITLFITSQVKPMGPISFPVQHTNEVPPPIVPVVPPVPLYKRPPHERQ